MPLQGNQRTLVIGGIVVGGGLLIGYMYEQNKKKKAAAAAAAAASAQAQSAYGYGSQYAYGYGSGYGAGGFYNQPEVYGYGLGYYGYGISGAGGGVVTPAATTNAMWSQAAVTQLTNQGYSGTDVQAALGVYLTGGALSSSQEAIVQSAIAVEGYPPQAGPNGFPPSMNTGATTGGGTGGGQNTGGGTTGGSGGGTTTQVRVPSTTGMSAGSAHNAIVAAGLVPNADPNQKATDIVTSTKPPAGTSVATGAEVIIVARNAQGQMT